jgi:hypothetical protein
MYKILSYFWGWAKGRVKELSAWWGIGDDVGDDVGGDDSVGGDDDSDGHDVGGDDSDGDHE